MAGLENSRRWFVVAEYSTYMLWNSFWVLWLPLVPLILELEECLVFAGLGDVPILLEQLVVREGSAL